MRYALALLLITACEIPTDAPATATRLAQPEPTPIEPIMLDILCEQDNRLLTLADDAFNDTHFQVLSAWNEQQSFDELDTLGFVYDVDYTTALDASIYHDGEGAFGYNAGDRFLIIPSSVDVFNAMKAAIVAGCPTE